MTKPRLYNDPFPRSVAWPDGLPHNFREMVLLQCQPTDCVTEEWPRDVFGPLWATAIFADRFEMGLHWDRTFPFCDLLDVMEDWLAHNPGRWRFRIFRATRHDRCHHGRS